MLRQSFFTGRGIMGITNPNISISMLRVAIAKKYRIRIIEESETHLKCKIYRLFRVYGGLVYFPNPTLTIMLDKESDINSLSLSFFWPDYFFCLLMTIIFGITSMNLLISIIPLVIFGSLTFIDTLVVSTTIWNILSKYRQ